MTNAYSILFGDIHNHNSLGYGVGSLERSIEIARSHLDFFAFTGHSSWHDIEPMEGGREAHWLRGFERLRRSWPKVPVCGCASSPAKALVLNSKKKNTSRTCFILISTFRF